MSRRLPDLPVSDAFAGAVFAGALGVIVATTLVIAVQSDRDAKPEARPAKTLADVLAGAGLPVFAPPPAPSGSTEGGESRG